MAFKLDLAQEAHLCLWLIRSSQTLAQLRWSHDYSIQEQQARSLFSEDRSPQVALDLAYQSLCSTMPTIAQRIESSFLYFQTKLVPLTESNPEFKAELLMLTILVIKLSFPLSELQAYLQNLARLWLILEFCPSPHL